MDKLIIRDAVVTDAAIIYQLICDLAAFQGAPDKVVAGEADIGAALFTDRSLNGVLCELDGKVVGMALYYFSFSTWLGKSGLYLEDLFVTDAARGHGAGKALLRHLAQIAVAKGCLHYEWEVLDWNTPAIGVYDGIGAKPQDGRIKYVLSGEGLAEFAAG